MTDSIPEATASSTTYWMSGLSTSGSISFGDALVAGKKRVPRPAAGKTALRTLWGISWILDFGLRISDFNNSLASFELVITQKREFSQMLDLNYVRENLDTVREALQKRDMPLVALDDFASADAERRRLIAESDQLNAERNSASREIGALIKEGKRDEADARRKAVSELKERIAELDRARDEAETRMRELLSTLPNIPH